MPSKRLVPAFDSGAKRLKARTALQQQFFDRQERERAQVQVRAELFLKTQAHSLPGDQGPSGHRGVDGAVDSTSLADNQEIPPPPEFAHENDNNSHDELRAVQDFRARPEDQDPMVAILDNAYHQSQRLAQEKRWSESYINMLTPFILYKHRTNGWADPITTHQDFKGTCECTVSNRRTRWVDLVDTECE